MKRKATYMAILGLLMLGAGTAHSECFGEGEYTVCTDTETYSNGDMSTRSWDSDGNNYQIDVETRQVGNAQVTMSSDSEGNEYSIRSWTDSSGSHVTDSEGNTCTITHSGQMIGCE
ncbi:hypothetical protein DNK10_18740 [Pseudomonas daroniae]|nr:hypothetical protein DNK10_18740 [Pseudomonas daroniae]